MGVPVVGERHHGKANTSQGAAGIFGTISKRISGMCGSRRSSVNNQQSIQAKEPAENNRQYSLGALLSRGNASQRDIHARCVSGVWEKLDSPTMGMSPFGRHQNDRGRTLATNSRSCRRDQSQDQVRHVGCVLACGSLGVLWPQSNFIGNTSWNGWAKRAKHGRTRQCEASEISARTFTGRGHTRSGTTGISRSDSRVSGRCLRNSARGTRGTTLAGLRFQQYELQCAAFLLLAPGWAPEEHKNGSVGKVVADASEFEAGLAGVEINKSLQPAGGFRLSFRKTEGKETARLGFGVEKEDPAGLHEDRHHRRRLAHLSAHGGDHAGRDGRTPINDPRLLASQRSARYQQISPGNDKKQTPRAGEARGCHSARGNTVGKQINLDPLTREVRFFGLSDGAKKRIGRWETLIGPKWTQIGFRGPL
jgi:hypothetical protein